MLAAMIHNALQHNFDHNVMDSPEHEFHHKMKLAKRQRDIINAI